MRTLLATASFVLLGILPAAAAPDQATLRCGTSGSGVSGLTWWIAGSSNDGDALRCPATCTIPLQDGQDVVKTCRFVIFDATDRALCAGSIGPWRGASTLNSWSCVSNQPGEWPQPPE